MRRARPFAIAVVGVLAVWLAAVAWLGTTGEVVRLTTIDASGALQPTPLWIVDHDGFAWLRAGSDDAAWLARIRANPQLVLQAFMEANESETRALAGTRA